MLPAPLPMAAASHPPGKPGTHVPWRLGREKALRVPRLRALLVLGMEKALNGGWSKEREESILSYLLQVPASLAPSSALRAVPAQGTLWSKGTQTGMVFPVLDMQTSCIFPISSELLLP